MADLRHRLSFVPATQNQHYQSMKRILLSTIMVGALALTSFAGGLLTNTNQSAQFVRMLSRNASLGIDAVYYNPAGVMKLENGFHISLNNQSIFQERQVSSTYPLLNNADYTGTVNAPVYPSGFAVYKMDKLAISAGFGIIGGGGSANFSDGLPSFEIPITDLVPGLAGLSQLPAPLTANVTGYNADLYFDGSSVFMGVQIGASLKISDMLSGYLGVRYVPATNGYNGHIKNIDLKVNGNFVNAQTFLSTTATGASSMAAQASAAATQLSGTASSLSPFISAGAGGLTMSQLQAMGQLSETQVQQLSGALISVGVPSANVGSLTISQIQGTFTTAAGSYTAASQQLTSTAGQLNATAGTLGDKRVDAKQTGAGWTPIVGFNYSPSDRFNLAVKYEHKTDLQLTNSTTRDDLGLFPDGQKSASDIPGMLAVGVGFNPSKLIETQLSYNLYFDKGVSWGNNVRSGMKREIESNSWELALGVQLNLTDRFAFSFGGMTSNPGIADSYQSDFSYSNPSVTAALGFEYKISKKLTFDAGYMNVFYQDVEVPFTRNTVNYKDTYGKTTFGLGFGLTYSIL